MDERVSGPAFLIRFDAPTGDGGQAGVATNIQSGERTIFADLMELARLFANWLESGQLAERATEPRGGGG